MCITPKKMWITFFDQHNNYALIAEKTPISVHKKQLSTVPFPLWISSQIPYQNCRTFKKNISLKNLSFSDANGIILSRTFFNE